MPSGARQRQSQLHVALSKTPSLVEMPVGYRPLQPLPPSMDATVDPNNTTAFAADAQDLDRLRDLILDRKVLNVLEFGVGHSSAVMAAALKTNKTRYAGEIGSLRRQEPFKIYSVDESLEWIDQAAARLPPELLPHVAFHHSAVEMGTFNGRVCTFYKTLPNVCPDLIYLDGPGQYCPEGDVRGISTRSPDRMPMAADILAMEHFLLPGTLILVDGRTANARFLKSNLQRDWSYTHDAEADVHLFDLIEPPLGPVNKRHLAWALNR